MFSFFTDNDVQRRTVINNENSVIARKPTLSARKPLSDRNTNLPKQATSSIKLKQTPRTIVPEKPAQDDNFIDFCSYKDVPDNFEDLATPYCVLGKNILDKLLGQFSIKNQIEPEPWELNLEQPNLNEKVVEINDSELLDPDSIAELLKTEINIVNDIDLDVPLPEYP